MRGPAARGGLDEAGGAEARARLERHAFECGTSVDGILLACVRIFGGMCDDAPERGLEGRSDGPVVDDERAIAANPFLCAPNMTAASVSAAWVNAARQMEGSSLLAAFPEGFWGAFLADLRTLSAYECADAFRARAALRALQSVCTSASPFPTLSPQVGIALTSEIGTLFAARSIAGGDDVLGADARRAFESCSRRAHAAGALFGGVSDGVNRGGGALAVLCSPHPLRLDEIGETRGEVFVDSPVFWPNGEGVVSLCSADSILAATRSASLQLGAAYFDGISAQSQLSVMLDASLMRTVRALLREGLRNETGAGFFHPTGLTVSGAGSPRYVLHFSAAYFAAEAGLEATLKGEGMARLSARARSTPGTLPTRIADPPALDIQLLSRCPPKSTRILIIDAHWHRGMTPHRCSRPMEVSIARAPGVCASLLYMYHAGIDGDEEERAVGGSHGNFVGGVVGVSADASAAWRAHAAVTVGSANFHGIFFASSGMSDADVDIMAALPVAASSTAVFVAPGHPSSARALQANIWVSGFEAEVVGPLQAGVDDVWRLLGVSSGVDACAARQRALKIDALSALIKSPAACGREALRGTRGFHSPPLPSSAPSVVVVCADMLAALAERDSAWADAAARAARNDSESTPCLLCVIADETDNDRAQRRFSPTARVVFAADPFERLPSVSVVAASVVTAGGSSAPTFAVIEDSAAPQKCRDTVPPIWGEDVARSSQQMWVARAHAARARYSERLLLVNGVGYAFTDIVERIGASLDATADAQTVARAAAAAALSPARLHALSTNLADTLIIGRNVGSSSPSPSTARDAEPFAVSAQELVALPWRGAAQSLPLRVALSWSNPKWSEDSFARALSAIRAAALAWRELHSVCAQRSMRAFPLCAALDGVSKGRLVGTAGKAVFYVSLRVFVPSGKRGLRPASVWSLLSRRLARVFPPDADAPLASVELELVSETSSLGDYLSRLRASDIAVDGLPFSAGVTVQDMAAARVPLLTLSRMQRGAGADELAWRSVLGGNVLGALGLHGLVALDVASFNGKFAALAVDPWLREAWARAVAAAPKASDALLPPAAAAAYGDAIAAMSEAYAAAGA